MAVAAVFYTFVSSAAAGVHALVSCRGSLGQAWVRVPSEDSTGGGTSVVIAQLLFEAQASGTGTAHGFSGDLGGEEGGGEEEKF